MFWGLLVPKPYTGKHCKAKQKKKKKRKRMISTAQNISNIIHPRLNFMHFIISNTKKSVLLFLSCVLPYLETGWRTCACVCVCACVVLRLLSTGWNGFSSGCFWRRPRWLRFYAPRRTSGLFWRRVSCVRLPAPPWDRRVYSSFLLAPGIFAWILDRENSLLTPCDQWRLYSRLACAYSNLLLVPHSSFLRKFTEAVICVNRTGLKDSRMAPQREPAMLLINPLNACRQASLFSL